MFEQVLEVAGGLHEGDHAERVLATEGEQAVDVAPRPRLCIVGVVVVDSKI